MTEEKYIEGIMGVLAREAFDLGAEGSALKQEAAVILAKASCRLFELLVDNGIAVSVPVQEAAGVH